MWCDGCSIREGGTAYAESGDGKSRGGGLQCGLL